MDGLQEIFDFVTSKLLEQNNKSIDGDMCMYRTTIAGYTLKCAAGHLIPDELYREEFERCFVAPSGLVDQTKGKYFSTKDVFGKEYTEKELRLIRRLQEVHDDYEVETWKRNFNLVAKDYDLKGIM